MSQAKNCTTLIRSRRAVLAGIASATVAPTAALSAAAADPIFAAIDTHREANAEYMAHEGPEDIPDELGDRQWDAYKAVLRTRPATLAGLAALTSFARERSEWLIANGSVLSHEDEREVFAAIDDATRHIWGVQS